MTENKTITYIDVDYLEVDQCNVRAGIWDYDKEFVENIKKMGVKQPLIVRELYSEKYGIVAGSRRFNAAIDAGLNKVPCVIEELSDKEAKLVSWFENRDRKETPKWRDVEQVGEIYEEYMDGTHQQKVEELSSRGTGVSTIEKYLSIYFLPPVVKGLIKPPEYREKHIEEIILRIKDEQCNKTLNLTNAELIATELENYPVRTQLEVGVFLLGKKTSVGEKVIEGVKRYPEMYVEDAYNMVLGKYCLKSMTVKLDDETFRALRNAVLAKQKDARLLIIETLRMWLIMDGYIDKTKKNKNNNNDVTLTKF